MIQAEEEVLITTHHWVPNFGANLQALATAEVVRACGRSPRFVDFRPAGMVAHHRRMVAEEQQKEHEEFVRANLPLTRPIATQTEFEDLCSSNSSAIAFVTGSDAVFRLQPGSGRADLEFPNPFWLVGTPPTARKIALAPSAMGYDFRQLPDAVRAGIQAACEQFDAVSIRDEWTRRQLRATGYQGPCPIIPDPVFGLSHHRPVVPWPAPRPYIVVGTGTTMAPEWVEELTCLADGRGYDTVGLPDPGGDPPARVTKPLEQPLDPMTWRAVISSSSGYVGTRFHPIVVALSAGVPVLSLDLYHRYPWRRKRSKTWLILRDFGLERHCIPSPLRRLLRPAAAIRMLESQQDGREAKQRHAALLARTFNSFLTTALAGESDKREWGPEGHR